MNANQVLLIVLIFFIIGVMNVKDDLDEKRLDLSAMRGARP